MVGDLVRQTYDSKGVGEQLRLVPALVRSPVPGLFPDDSGGQQGGHAQTQSRRKDFERVILMVQRTKHRPVRHRSKDKRHSPKTGALGSMHWEVLYWVQRRGLVGRGPVVRIHQSRAHPLAGADGDPEEAMLASCGNWNPTTQVMLAVLAVVP